jgi:hypothetical protein
MNATTMNASLRAAAGWRRRLPGWAREPLLHFVLLGLALFAIDHAVSSRRDDPHRIVVTRAVDDEARQIFKGSRGREPNAAELQALRRAYLDNEILYREGLALQVDRGDPTIRERVIFKALSVVDANLRPPPADEKVLRAWFEQHRERYDEPARFDFEEAVMAGTPSEGEVREFAYRLNHGTPGDADAGLRVFKARPRASLVDGYGAPFAEALERAPRGEWQALQTRSGWRAIRVTSASSARPANFDALHGVVRQDWLDATMAAKRTEAVRALGRKYDVVYEGVAK